MAKKKSSKDDKDEKDDGRDQLNVRLEKHVAETIKTLADVLACSQAAVVTQAVRLLARREGVPVAQKKSLEKRDEEA